MFKQIKRNHIQTFTHTSICKEIHRNGNENIQKISRIEVSEI